MPIYEYKCSNCNHKLRKLHKSYKNILTICPICTKNTLTILISNTNFILKGKGWYKTDNPKKNK